MIRPVVYPILLEDVRSILTGAISLESEFLFRSLPIWSFRWEGSRVALAAQHEWRMSRYSPKIDLLSQGQRRSWPSSQSRLIQSRPAPERSPWRGRTAHPSRQRPEDQISPSPSLSLPLSGPSSLNPPSLWKPGERPAKTKS